MYVLGIKLFDVCLYHLEFLHTAKVIVVLMVMLVTFTSTLLLINFQSKCCTSYIKDLFGHDGNVSLDSKLFHISSLLHCLYLREALNVLYLGIPLCLKLVHTQ